MSLGYLLIILVQPLVAIVPMAVTFSIRRKRYIIYSYLAYLSYIFGLEFINRFEQTEKHEWYFLAFGLLELFIPVIFSRFFLNNQTWRSSVLFYVIGLISNSISYKLILCFPITQKSFDLFINYKRNSVELPSAILIGVIYASVTFLISFIFRKLLSGEKQSQEKIFCFIYILYIAISAVTVIGIGPKPQMSEDEINKFYGLSVPLLTLFLLFICFIFFFLWERNHVSNKYRKLTTEKRNEKGDSNKSISVFEDGSPLNEYFNNKINELKAKGVTVDVVSYLSEKINTPEDYEKFIREIDNLFLKFDTVRAKRHPFLVMSFKINKEGFMIFAEYNHRGNGTLISRLMQKEYLYVMENHFLLYRRCLLSDEILLLYPHG
ncbi:MAG: hypothetical protein K6E10_09290 [Eubacterium sp.]|nr:hypothetical protein [Eubacterium sp.]